MADRERERERKYDGEDVKEEDDGRKSRRIRMRYRLPG